MTIRYGPPVQINGPPFPGQGTDIPSHFGRGTWVIDNLLYLSLEGAVVGPDHTVILSASAPDGATPYAISAPLLAKKLKVAVDDLLAGNREGKLNVRFQGPQAGADPRIVCWWFRLGDAVAPILVRHDDSVGGRA